MRDRKINFLPKIMLSAIINKHKSLKLALLEKKNKELEILLVSTASHGDTYVGSKPLGNR